MHNISTFEGGDGRELDTNTTSKKVKQKHELKRCRSLWL